MRDVEKCGTHFVGRFFAPSHQSGWIVGVSGVVGRVVVKSFERDAGAARECDGCFVHIGFLPVKVPGFDPYQRFLGAVGIGCGYFHFCAEQVHVGQDAEQVLVAGDGDCAGYSVLFDAGGNEEQTAVDDFFAELFLYGFLGEVDAQSRVVFYGAANFVIVDLEDDVAVGR